MKSRFKTTQYVYEYIMNNPYSIFTIDSVQNEFENFSNESIRKALSVLKNDEVLFGNGLGVYYNFNKDKYFEKDFIFIFEKIKKINVEYIKEIVYVKTPEYLLLKNDLTQQIPTNKNIIISRFSDNFKKLKNIFQSLLDEDNTIDEYVFLYDEKNINDIVNRFFSISNIKYDKEDNLNKMIDIFNDEYKKLFYISHKRDYKSNDLLKILYSNVSMNKYNEILKSIKNNLYLNIIPLNDA